MAKVFCGIDFHKNTSTLCALTQDGKEVEPVSTIRTDRLALYLSNRRDWKIGIEATGGVNHVVDQLKAQGHEVVIINSNKFRGIGIGGKKTDQRDARALAEALRLSFVPEVYHRSKYARQIKSLLTTREIFVRSRVNAMNHVRGTLREYGLIMPAGAENFYEQVRSKIAQLEVTALHPALNYLVDEIVQWKVQEKALEAAMIEIAGQDERFARLQTAPGIGPMTALAMIAVVDDITRFKNAKEFASYIGLVPSVSASANKRMMGSITRSGSEMLRRYLIHGSRAWMRYSAGPGKDPNRNWAERVKERRGMNKAVVALAHRMARIAFAMMKNNTAYKPPHAEAA